MASTVLRIMIAFPWLFLPSSIPEFVQRSTTSDERMAGEGIARRTAPNMRRVVGLAGRAAPITASDDGRSATCRDEWRKDLRRFLALALTLTASGPALAQDTGMAATGGCATVPILPASIPVVEATIGGRGPYRFAIDTAEQGHGRISAALAAELGLPKLGEVDTASAGGTTARRAVFAAPEVSVGSVSFKNPDLVALSVANGEAEWD